MTEQKLVQVLVDCPGMDGMLTYAIPDGMNVMVGDILTVPFGDRYVGAIALEIPTESNFEGEIREVYAVVSTGIFPPHFWQLLTRTADYYRTPIMQTVKAALPPRLMDQSSYRIRIDREVSSSLSAAAQAVWEFLQAHVDRTGSVSRRYLYQKLPRLAASGLRSLMQMGCISTVLEIPPPPQPKYEDVVVLLEIIDDLTARQREILTILQRLGGECIRSKLIEQAKTTYPTLQTLAAKGCISIDKREYLRLGGKAHFVASDRPKQLTSAQQAAVAKIQTLAPPNLELLLHGVTGSGKTEVYLQSIAVVLAQGKSALVLVPEIGLTPQLTDRFRARFGDARVNVYHSKLSEGERFDTWRQMLTDTPQVVVGTRSAVFAPLSNLGLIVLDEEHDPSFKQDQPQPCYHARTVAQWRSKLESCPLILGSATPSAEMLYAIEGAVGRQDRIPTSQYITLPNRIGNKPMPPISIVDMRLELAAGHRSIFSRQLQDSIERMLEQQKQGILFIHRRGFSTFVSCRSCGYVMNCPNCDVSLAFHNPTANIPIQASHHASPIHSARINAGDLRCHYCNFTQIKPANCPACGSTYFKHFGSGTQRVEQEISDLFPAVRMIRFDSDTTRNKDQHRQLIERFQAGEADLLVGTQMLTKGLDIPQVTLVGVVSADGLLNFSDYRSGERAFQTLTQVAGRAGRGDDPGEVIIQTYTPEHPVIEAVKDYNFDEFMQVELAQRQALNYPPAGQMALIHLSSEQSIEVERAANQLTNYLQSRSIEWEILGPVPALIARVSNRFRWQIMLKFSPELLPQLPQLEDLRSQVDPKIVRVSIDIDPLTIL